MLEENYYLEDIVKEYLPEIKTVLEEMIYAKNANWESKKTITLYDDDVNTFVDFLTKIKDAVEECRFH